MKHPHTTDPRAWPIESVYAVSPLAHPPGRPRAADWHPPDTGCSFSPRCTECPLPACRYEMPPKVAGTIAREMQVTELEARGLTVKQIAAAMGVTRRTVFRLRLSRQQRATGAKLAPRERRRREQTG